ncbi:MAG: hypothetical protein ACR2FG_03025 [Marmoricola sp.]
MPMPPPRPSTERRRDRHVAHEVKQLARALRTEGDQTAEDLARLVGAAYWEDGRFDKALAVAVTDGFVVRTAEGTLAAT